MCDVEDLSNSSSPVLTRGIKIFCVQTHKNGCLTRFAHRFTASTLLMSHTHEQSHDDDRGLITSLWKHNMADAAHGGLPGELERRGEIGWASHLDEGHAERGRRLLLLLAVPDAD